MDKMNDLDVNPSDFKIMVVDDVPANVLLLRVLLTSSKYKVVTCGGAREALEKVKTENPDLILLDVMMPEMSGFDVAQILKSDPDTFDIPIIFLTALDNKEDVVKGFNCGASDYIAKPLEKEILLVRVLSQLKLVKSRRVIAAQNEELRQTIYGRDKLYSVISHDLRSPLGAVQLSVKVLEDMIQPESIGEDIYNLIVESGKQVSEVFNLLDNLLKWTKSQTGRLNVVYQDFALEDMVGGALDMYENVARQKNISLRLINNEVGHTVVHADIEMCKTVLRNFLSNAIKFSEEHTEIQVGIKTDGDFAVMSVTDTGCGLSPEDQSRLFHRDTHFTKYGTAREEGSGLGLLLCNSFAEKNGGKLTLDSKLGKGSTFSMYIPLYKEVSE